MSDLTSILRVATRQAAEIIDIPQVIGTWEDLIQAFARGIESRLPEIDEYFRVESLPYPERAALQGTPAWQTYLDARKMYFISIIFPEDSFDKMRRMGGGYLFLALLQKYEIGPALRRKVEAAAKFWSKTRMQKAKKGQEVETFKKTMNTYREHLALAKTVMSQSVDRSTATPDQVKTWTAGPFRLLNTGGFDDKTMEECSMVLEKAVQLMKSKGITKPLYGDIMISKTVDRKTSILAFYLPSKDEMFVRANLKNFKAEAVKTVIHELAHRLQTKFMSGKQSEVNAMYRTIASKSRDRDREKLKALLGNPELMPKPGDTLEDGGKLFQVERVVYDTVILHLVEEPRAKAKINILAYARKKGINIETPNNSGFVTNYAATNADENFAEMVSYYCVGELAQDQVELLEKLLG
jgi:hypothetical protein